MLPQITVTKKILFSGLHLYNHVKVRVLLESGREIVGSVPFDWDSVTEKIAAIEIEHPSAIYRYEGASKYAMYNSTVATWDGLTKVTCLHVGAFDGTTTKGHIFFPDGIVHEAVFDLDRFSQQTRDMILK